MPRPAVFCHTLGCDKNLVDSEALLGRFRRRGFDVTDSPDDAAIWILNSCGFIDAARRDSRETLEQLAAAKEAGIVLAVTGCWSQEHGQAIDVDFPAVDVIGGVGEFDRLVTACEEALTNRRVILPAIDPRRAQYEGFAGRPRLTPRHVAFVKIAEGCDRTCTFCRIPMIRGKMRSRSIDEIRAEVAGLAADGVREIQLVSQNTSDFGRDRDESLTDLCAALGGVEELRWIRLLYLYGALQPLDTVLEILDLPRVAPYLDMPIQHAAPDLLRAMKRPGDPDRVAGFFEQLRDRRPDLVLRTTVLLGFPGEEDEHVEQLADFLARVEFDHVGTYRYSPEAGTKAATLADPPPDEAVADREALILDLQAEVALGRQRRRLGAVHGLVVDDVRPAGKCPELLSSLREGEFENEGEPAGLFAVGEEDAVALGRSVHYGYDLDGGVALPGDGLAPGDRLDARFTAVTPFDVWAAPVRPDR